jgi:hypothetical protein
VADVYTETESDAKYLTQVSASSTYQTQATSGMVLLNTTSFTTQSTVSVNDVFSSIYDNYKIVASFNTPTADSGVLFRFRVSGSDNTTSNYVRTCQHTSSSAITNRSDTSTSFDIIQTDLSTAEGYAFTYEIQKPFLTEFTTGQVATNGVFSTGTKNTLAGGLLFSANTSFTGFTVFNGSGNISGTLSVYGYRN